MMDSGPDHTLPPPKMSPFYLAVLKHYNPLIIYRHVCVHQHVTGENHSRRSATGQGVKTLRHTGVLGKTPSPSADYKLSGQKISLPSPGICVGVVVAVVVRFRR